jgi:RNA polymerase sigma-70 factor (ECF subfamily)
VDRAVVALGVEAQAEGRTAQFNALKPWLVGEKTLLSQAEAAREPGLSEGAVKVAVHRLGKRFRELVQVEISQTVSNPVQVTEELRYLVEGLA